MSPEQTQTLPGSGLPEHSPASFSTTLTDTTLSEALITLRKRRWVLIVAVLLGLAYGLYKALSQPTIYEAYGRIQVRSGSSNEYRLTAIGSNDDASSKMLTEIAILQSDSVMLSVVREMDLANNATFLTKPAPAHRASLADPQVRQVTVHRLQSSVHITLVPKTDIIRISCESLSPKLSADIVNKIIATYIQRSYETRFESTKRVSQWLQGQLDDLKQDVET
jgi:polysaccharide biosynthesis transport protein